MDRWEQEKSSVIGHKSSPALGTEMRQGPGCCLLGALMSLVVEWLRGESVHIARNGIDRKSTRLNSSHANISYAVFCLKKNNPQQVGRAHDATAARLRDRK